MARNFAQIVFLVYGLVILLISHKHLVSFLRRKLGKRGLEKASLRGANAYLLITLKEQMPPALFWLNVMNFSALFVLGVLQLVIGWFAFADLALKILGALVILSIGAQAYFLSVLGNLMAFGEAFFWYRPDPDPKTQRAFASSVLDAVVYAILPILMAISNFLL